MGNERERQLHSKLLKTKEELKLEREEVNTCIQFMKRFQVEYRSWNRCIPWLKRSIHLGWNKPCSGRCESSWEQTQMDFNSSHRGEGSAMFLVVALFFCICCNSTNVYQAGTSLFQASWNWESANTKIKRKETGERKGGHCPLCPDHVPYNYASSLLSETLEQAKLALAAIYM